MGFLAGLTQNGQFFGMIDLLVCLY